MDFICFILSVHQKPPYKKSLFCWYIYAWYQLKKVIKEARLLTQGNQKYV